MKTPFDATLTDPSGSGRNAAASLSLVGSSLAHFRIDRLLGKGGMGEVYEATDTALDRRVAVKVLPPDVAQSSTLRERFLREARAQARLQHPNVCHIYYVGEQDGLLFFAMEYIDGESLAERMAREQRIAPDQALELVRMAALGLREAHRHGFTHRDVKPSNLMVDKGGTLKVVDFGLVKQTGTPTEGGTAPVGADGTALVGTPLYMAPEQAGGDPIDLRADIYALGATLHHLVCGAPPFAGDSALDLASKHLSSPRPKLAAPGRSNRALAPVDALVEHMMKKLPAERPADYDDLVAELERLSPARTRPAGFWVRFFAACIDMLLVSLATIPIALLLQSDSNNLALAVLLVLYSVLCIGRWGRTLGHAALEIEVVRTDGRRAGFARAAVRTLHQQGPIFLFGGGSVLAQELAAHDWLVSLMGALTILSVLRLPFAVGLASLWRPDKRTGWDRAAGTMVRYRRLG